MELLLSLQEVLAVLEAQEVEGLTNLVKSMNEATGWKQDRLTVREPIVKAIAQVINPILYTSNFVSSLVYITREPLV